MLQGFSVHKKIVTASNIFQTVRGNETRVLTQAFPVWEFQLTYEGLRTETENIIKYDQYSQLTDYERILAVFLTCKGSYGRFFFSDPSDYSRGDQFIGVGNSVRTKFRLVRTIGSGGLEYTEPVGGADLSFTPIVKVNGVVQPFGWLVLSDFQTLEFSSPPIGNVTITYQYFYYCRFTKDIEEFEEFAHNLHSMQTLEFRSTKDTDRMTPNPWFLGYYVA